MENYVPNRKIYLNFVSKCDLKISVKRNFFFKNNFKPVFKFHLEILKKSDFENRRRKHVPNRSALIAKVIKIGILP
jgi:hypothetical protein